jgi:hypothetical protein
VQTIYHRQKLALVADAGDRGVRIAAGLVWADLFPEKTTTTQSKIVAEYHHHDEDGRHLYDVVKLAPKDFRQRSERRVEHEGQVFSSPDRVPE